LDISKIEAGKVEINVEAFDLAEVLDQVVSTIQPLATKNRNKLEIKSDESIMMVSDRTKICQVLVNVASNACKFTEDGTVSISVGCGTNEKGEFVQISVSDNGIGIPPEV